MSIRIEDDKNNNKWKILNHNDEILQSVPYVWGIDLFFDVKSKNRAFKEVEEIRNKILGINKEEKEDFAQEFKKSIDEQKEIIKDVKQYCDDSEDHYAHKGILIGLDIAKSLIDNKSKNY